MFATEANAFHFDIACGQYCITTFNFSNNIVSIIVIQDGQWIVGDVLEDVSSTDVYQTLLHQHRHTGRT